LVTFAALIAAVEIDGVRTGKNLDVAVGIVVIAVFAGGGLLLVRLGRRMRGSVAGGELAGPALEQRVLSAARRQHGRVTAVSVAADGGVMIEQARAELERLAKANACLMEVSADGLVEFRFPEFEKRQPSA